MHDRSARPTLSPSSARELAAELVRAAQHGSSAERSEGETALLGLDARSWLVLDEAARRPVYLPAVVSGGGWELGDTEDSAFTAAVASFHVDGHVRERACRRLGLAVSPLAARALAVRLLDHVPQVRGHAWRALRPRLDEPALAVVVLEVLLAAASRAAAPAVTASTGDVLLDGPEAADRLQLVLRTGSAPVRRWAFSAGTERGLLDGDQLLAAVHDDPDQAVRALCAEHVARSGDPAVLHRLLAAPSVPARLAAAMRIPPADLTEREVEALLVDGSARVREHGRWAAARRGADVAAWCRGRLDAVTPHRPQVLVALLEGLAAAGSAGDAPRFTEHVQHASARVRLAALEGLLGVLDDERVTLLATRTLLDASPRVADAAARALVRRGAAAGLAAAAAWESDQPWSRRAAWRVDRAASSRDRLESDLRASADPDPVLAGLGLAGVRGWVEHAADLYWDAHDPARDDRLLELFAAAPLSARDRLRVAFSAGLPAPPAPDVLAPQDVRLRRLAWWRHRGRPRRSAP